jgi:hypothetical protein
MIIIRVGSPSFWRHLQLSYINHELSSSKRSYFVEYLGVLGIKTDLNDSLISIPFVGPSD